MCGRLNTGASELSSKKKDGRLNIRRCKASLDFSLDQIALRDAYEKFYRRKNFSQKIGKKEYCTSVVSVTFKYAVNEYNAVKTYDNSNVFVKYGYSRYNVNLVDCVQIENGELAAIQLGGCVENPISRELLEPHFEYDEELKTYKQSKKPKTMFTRVEAREEIYKNGFDVDGVHYVRWKRSAGSARVGKCLFIDENLFKAINKRDFCGLNIKPGDQIDLASVEAYTALTASGIIDTIEIKPENFLIIDDYDSVFSDDVVSVEDIDGKLKSIEKRCEISNCIWDGQGLIDCSLMGKYSDKGMLLLRNRFFKSCCFNTNIQKWFEDNGITEVSQLNGFTLAESVSDIKLITTPSSIKYVKFGTIEEWLNNVDTTFGIVKHEKKTHYFDGRYVSTHYQLLNSIQMTPKEVDEFLAPTLEYIKNIKSDPAFLRYHIKFGIDNSDLSPTNPLRTKQDIIYNLLGLNERFAKTKLYKEFVADTVRAYIKNIRNGHILVSGNYSTLFGNPVEMLRHSIGQFNGHSEIGVGNVVSKRFKPGESLLGSRSPHISISNVYLVTNTQNENIDKYFNLTEEIVCVNSINENTMERLAGADFDSDTVLLTNNEILIKAARKNIFGFKVAVNHVKSLKMKRFYTPEQQCDLDAKTSTNKIGEIVNLSQELNTIIWNMINSGATYKEVNEIYLDVCKLSVMSNLEIDSAKREFEISNIKELRALREKYERREDSKAIKPYFFVFKDKSKGYFIPDHKAYNRHDTTMDYLEAAVNRFVYAARNVGTSGVEPFSSIVDHSDYNIHSVTKSQVEKVLNEILDYKNKITTVYAQAREREEKPSEEEYNIISDLVYERNEKIEKIKFNKNTMIYFLDLLDKEKYSSIKNLLFESLFGIPNTSFYEVINNEKENITVLQETTSDKYDTKIYEFYFDKIQV